MTEIDVLIDDQIESLLLAHESPRIGKNKPISQYSTAVYCAALDRPESPGQFFFKFGYGSHPRSRIGALQTGCPYPIHFRCALFVEDLDLAVQIERDLHWRFDRAGFHVSGEWFCGDQIIPINELVRSAREIGISPMEYRILFPEGSREIQVNYRQSKLRRKKKRLIDPVERWRVPVELRDSAGPPYTVRQALIILGIPSKDKLSWWRRTNSSPPFQMVGDRKSHLVYPRQTFWKWIDEHSRAE